MTQDQAIEMAEVYMRMQVREAVRLTGSFAGGSGWYVDFRDENTPARTQVYVREREPGGPGDLPPIWITAYRTKG